MEFAIVALLTKANGVFVALGGVGRSIKVLAYDLYEKAVPDEEIFHAYRHAISPDKVGSFNLTEPNIVEKTKQFIDAILKLGDLLHKMSLKLGINTTLPPEEYIGFDLKYKFCRRLEKLPYNL